MKKLKAYCTQIILAIIRGRIFFIFQLDIRKYKDENIQNYDFSCCFVRVWNLVSHIEGGT
jgi:hypothetical protein